MTLLAVAPTKFSAGVELPGTPIKRRDPRGKVYFEPATYDWRAPPGSPDNTAPVRAAYTATAVDRALTDAHSTDAHFVAYVVRREGAPLLHQPRINKPALPWVCEQGYRVTLEALVADVDNPRHAAWASPAKARAEVARVSALLGTCAVYATTHGLRVLQPLSRAVPVEDCEVSIRVWLAQLEGRGLAVDWKCDDWTRHFRAPHVRRDGGDYRSPAVLLERMRHVEAPVGKASPRARTTRARAGAVEVAAMLSPTWAKLVEPLSRPLAANGHHGERHELGLALAGALLSRRVTPAEVPALVAEVARAAGWKDPEHHRQSAIDTVRRWAEGHRVKGLSALPALVAEALEHATDRRRAELAAEVPRRRPLPLLADTTRKLEQTIRDAPEGLSVIRAACGLGKTRAARLVALERAMRGGAHKPNTKTGIAVPTNDLAIQVATDLRAAGAQVRRLFGPLSVPGPYDGFECRYRASAAALAEGGQSTRKLFCTTCEYQSECSAVDGEEGPHDARILVGPQALLAELEAGTGKTGLLFIDEPPSVLEDEVFSIDDLAHAERHLADHFEARYAAAMAPVINAVRVWAEASGSPVEAPGPLLRAFEAGVDVALEERAFDVTGATTLLEAVALAQEKPGAPPLLRTTFASARSVLSLAQRVGRASRVLRAVHRALTRQGVTATLYDRGERRLTITGVSLPLARALAREGRTVVAAADAHLYLDAYETVLGYRPAFHEFVAGDGAPIARTLLLLQKANRRGWAEQGSLDAAIRAAAAWIREAPVEAVGVVTFQHVEARVRRLLREELAGVRVEVAHYGAVRGLDAWRDFDAVVTLGDPWPNLDHVARELGGEAPEGARNDRAEARARAELEQAHGRLRTVHRSKPGRALHVGALLPGGWVEPIEIRRPAAGRPRRAEAPGELAALVEAAGGARAVGRLVGRSHTTVMRWLTGEGRPHASDLDVLRGAGPKEGRPTGDTGGGAVSAYKDPIRGVTAPPARPSPGLDPDPSGGGAPAPSGTPSPRVRRAPSLGAASSDATPLAKIGKASP